MFDIGFSELLVIAILGLLVLGPEKLPAAARTLGLLIGRVRRTMNNFQDELERQVRAEELREKLKDPYATFINNEPVASQDKTAIPGQTTAGDSTRPAEANKATTVNTIQPPASLAKTVDTGPIDTDTAAVTPSVNPVSITPTPRQQDNQPAS
jgi:sec-independent protein translocase protein TatB